MKADEDAVVGIVLAILVVASIGVGYLAGNSGSLTETLTSTSIVTSQQTEVSSTTFEKTITSVCNVFHYTSRLG